ncbi:MAG: class I SAM-dependent methyltransferase [Pseudomonadota bacterium]
MAKHYDNNAAGWNRKTERLGLLEAYRGLVHSALKRAQYVMPQKELDVLDAGIGTGAMSKALGHVLGRRFNLEGIDISANMLIEAKRYLCMEDINLSLSQSEVCALPFSENSFDIVLIGHVVEHLGCPELAFKEAYRVLRPGGIIVGCVTRQSVAAAYVQYIWHTHQVSMKQAQQWLKQSGFGSVKPIPLSKRSSMRKFSIGYVGRKPECASAMH